MFAGMFPERFDTHIKKPICCYNKQEHLLEVS